MTSSTFTSSIPAGNATKVRIIDSTSRIGNLPLKFLMKPEMPGMENMPELPTWSFLIEHHSGRKVLFDLGVPVDFEDLAPSVSKRLKKNGWAIKVEKPTVELLKQDGIEAKDIEAIVWSHNHWDHIGNPSHFPSSTTLIVGPGFKSDPELYPGYPSNEDPEVKTRDSDFANRELREISFSKDDPATLQIGPFRAHDYFGDGSFYLLDTPGHATGHLAGLARTTTSSSSSSSSDTTFSTGTDTFLFMGGDLTHHQGELRPSPHLPLPTSIPLSKSLPFLSSHICPGSVLQDLQTSRSRAPESTTPFFDPAMGKDIDEVVRTIQKTQLADADENVLYVFAHDGGARGIIELFPEGTANGWKEKGWKEKMLWGFVGDFEGALGEVAGKKDKSGDGEREESRL